ncbi:hypothetical protein [Piscirickettsia salmonis]|uniref:hypothetical protein n=1 Tax=Piscirickettsia salmonis TaxID=1238 RepID=UPI0018C8AA25|nr:hypothetical protein [Piscirickettsia salmonis]
MKSITGIKANVCIERCQARTGRAQRNHISLSIAAWVDKYKRKLNEKLVCTSKMGCDKSGD